MSKVLPKVEMTPGSVDYATAHFRWSKAWKLTQERYEAHIGGGIPPMDRTWDGNRVSVAGYATGGSEWVMLASADKEEICGEPGGSLGMRFTRGAGDRWDELKTQEQWAYGVTDLPEHLLHFDDSDTWVGVLPGLKIFLLGGSERSVDSQDVYTDHGCGC